MNSDDIGTTRFGTMSPVRGDEMEFVKEHLVCFPVNYTEELTKNTCINKKPYLSGQLRAISSRMQTKHTPPVA